MLVTQFSDPIAQVHMYSCWHKLTTQSYSMHRVTWYTESLNMQSHSIHRYTESPVVHGVTQYIEDHMQIHSIHTCRESLTCSTQTHSIHRLTQYTRSHSVLRESLRQILGITR